MNIYVGCKVKYMETSVTRINPQSTNVDKNGLILNGPIIVYCTDGGPPMSRNT